MESEDEQATIARAREMTAALSGYYDGTGMACVAGIDAAEATRRLAARPAQGRKVREFLDGRWDHPWTRSHESHLLVGVTDVPGGCVVAQPWDFAPSRIEVVKALSVGTVCYGLFANPKSGNQGSITRDGVVEGWDLHPGGGAPVDDSPEEALRARLYLHNAVAYACDFAGLHLTDERAVVGPADRYIWLPPSLAH